MDTTVLTSIVAGSSALAGVALSSVVQTLVQRRSQEFQLKHEEEKWERERRENEIEQALNRIVKAHIQLSVLGREFSLTTFSIIWSAGMDSSEYDQRYLAVCEQVDELRAMVGIFEESISEEVEKLYGLMNIFWGNFAEVLRATSEGEEVDQSNSCFQKAHAAAVDIGDQASALKVQLNVLAHRYRRGG